MQTENKQLENTKHRTVCDDKLYNDTIDTRGFDLFSFISGFSSSHTLDTFFLFIILFICMMYVSFSQWNASIGSFILWSLSLSLPLSVCFSFFFLLFLLLVQYFSLSLSLYYFSFGAVFSFWKLMSNICNIFQLCHLSAVYPNRMLFVHTRPNQI